MDEDVNQIKEDGGFSDRRSFLRKGLLVGGAALGAGLLSNVLQPAESAYAAIINRNIVSYNMRGSTNGGDNRWVTEVPPLIRDNEIVVLQEVGEVPAATAHLSAIRQTIDGPVYEYSWEANGVVYWLYFVRNDNVNGGNSYNNLAIITRVRADGIDIIPPQGGNRSRRALGVRLGNDDWIYTLHARSGGGFDASAIVDRVALRRSAHNWAVVGDFNIDLQTVTPNFNASYYIYRPNQVTRIGLTRNSELDFMVANRAMQGYTARVLGGGTTSDHLPVAFSYRFQAHGGPYLLEGNFTNVRDLDTAGRNYTIAHPGAQWFPEYVPSSKTWLLVVMNY